MSELVWDTWDRYERIQAGELAVRVAIDQIDFETSVPLDQIRLPQEPRLKGDVANWVNETKSAFGVARRRLERRRGERRPAFHNREPRFRVEIPTREIGSYDETGAYVTEVVQIPLSERNLRYANGVGAALSAEERVRADQRLREDSKRYRSGSRRETRQ